MKKLLFSVAILAVAASCSQNEVVDMPQTNQIGFSSLRDRVVSKAANDNDSDFRVFASAGDATAWLIDDYVTKYESGSKAPVGGPYYWPADKAALTFYAYAPYFKNGGNVVEGAITTTTMPLTYTVPTGAQEDFTVAELKAYAPAATPAVAYPKDGIVPFKFNHMLSKVTVEVVLETEYAEKYEISTATDLGDAEFTATFTALKNVVKADPILNTAATQDAAAGATFAYSGETSYYIAPQAFKDCVLQINGITVRDQDTKVAMLYGDLSEITLLGSELNADGETGTDAAFEAGKHYVFTITISGESEDQPEILFSATNTAWTAAGDANIGLAQ